MQGISRKEGLIAEIRGAGSLEALLAVQGGDVTIQHGGVDRPHQPPRVLDLVLDAPAVTSGRAASSGNGFAARW